MSIYRDKAEREDNSLETIKAGCPICKSDVIGDDVYLFFCKSCNILFKREELRLNSPEQIKETIKERIAQNFEKDKDKIKIKDEIMPLKIKKISRKHRKLLKEYSKAVRVTYLASKSSDILHASNCPFAKNIKKENKIVFKSLEDAKKYRKCRCISD